MRPYSITNLIFYNGKVKTNESDYKDERLKELGTELARFDIIGMQEMFGSFSSRREKLIELLSTNGFTHFIHAPKPPIGVFVDGGLVIASKLPIVTAQWSGFPRGTHSDALAEKGVLYAKVELTNQQDTEKRCYLHVFNTHTQVRFCDVSAWRRDTYNYEIALVELPR
jgi:endonuclease/exonuclease/phosphatase family metal-dependent hydrolase